MHPASALPIDKAVGKIAAAYDAYYPDLAKFSLTSKSPLLNTVAVFQALLCHAIAPSSVALALWKVIQAYFNGVLVQHGDPKDPQSLTLSPSDGEWVTVDNWLLRMTETVLHELTGKMNDYAREWVTMVLLPIRSRGKTPGTRLSNDSSHQRVRKFREQILQREGYKCPVTYLMDEGGFDPNSDDVPLVSGTLEAAYIIPFALGNTQSLVWQYIEMFTGSKKVQDILREINVVENGILFQHDVHVSFGDFAWGIHPKTENGTCRYFIKTFRPRIYFQRSGVGDGTEIHFSTTSGHNPPNPDLCRLHLAVCAVAHACGAAAVFNKLFQHDPDIIGPVAEQYTLPTDPTDPNSDSFVIPYFERRLLEESIHVPRVDNQHCSSLDINSHVHQQQ